MYDTGECQKVNIMALKVYNTLSRTMEPFESLEKGKVGMYVCGPTTYDLSHMGHARAYVAFDVIRRYLEYIGYQVNYVQNFTDVDDKIINRSAENGKEPLEFSRIYIDEYFKDMDMLGIKRATHHPLASETINDMIVLVKGLIEKGYAYNVNGNVYFSINKALDMAGQLTHQPLEDMLDGARVEVNPEKKHPKDFALWKRTGDGTISWDSPWGPGRPGWHIECSAMAKKYIGETLDIHGGGQDLIFPHHESEILQSECYTGKKFSRYWLHNGFVRIDQEKMSKSLGNFFTIREVIKKFAPATIRFFFLYTHYRQPIDYSEAHLEEAERSLGRIETTITSAERYLGEKEICPGQNTETEHVKTLEEAKASIDKFKRAMEDDFNTRRAIASIFEFTRIINRAIKDRAPTEVVDKMYHWYGEVLGVLGLEPEFIKTSRACDGKEAPTGQENELVELLISIRNEMREKKNWVMADRIRNRLLSLGFILEDVGSETVFKRK